MLPQGVLGFQYESDSSNHGLTSLAGLPLYLELIQASGLGAAILSAIERDLLSRAERRSLKKRWRHARERVMPSPSALSGWLERFHDPAAAKAVAGSAFIPAVTDELRGLWRANRALPGFMQTHQPAISATLDMDATLIETHKRDALYCYKKFKAFQPLNCWWAQQRAMLYSEFRDGNSLPLRKLAPAKAGGGGPRRTRTTARAEDIFDASAGQREEGFITIRHGRLPGRVAVLW
jgi:hypothetical protein